MTAALKIAIIGSGSWGSAISKLVGSNAAKSPYLKTEVSQWVFEEIVEGRKLTEWVNLLHENRRYLSGIQLPSNIYAIPDILECIDGADLLIFVIPHQFLVTTLHQIEGHIKPGARAISLIKGFHSENGRPLLFTEMISRTLKIPCDILSGANVASGVAREEFCESTLGYSNFENAELWQVVFDTPAFKVNSLPDVRGVEICGALKNVIGKKKAYGTNMNVSLIALAAGFSDGLGLETNTKAAIIRLGMNEMKLFASLFYDGIIEETFVDSAGYADTITTCFGGRNVRCASEFVRRRPPIKVSDPEEDERLWHQIEKELLNGQKLQGTLTCRDVYSLIEYHKLFDSFPLFTTTHHIAFRGIPAERIVGIFMTEKLRRVQTAKECHAVELTEIVRALRKQVGTDINNLSSCFSFLSYQDHSKL